MPLAVPRALGSRTRSLFHGNPPALEFTSFPDMEPLEVFISSPNDVSRSCHGYECLTGVGGRNGTDWARQEAEVLCIRPACLLPGPNPTEAAKQGFLTAGVLGAPVAVAGENWKASWEKGDPAGRALGPITGPLTSYPRPSAQAFRVCIHHFALALELRLFPSQLSTESVPFWLESSDRRVKVKDLLLSGPDDSRLHHNCVK